MVQSFRAMVAEARRHGSLYFAALLPRDRILKAFQAARATWQGWVYTPAITVWAFLSQCLSPDHSCRDAVARLIAWRLAQGLPTCSADTGGYCTARNNLPEEVLHGLTRHTGRQAEDESPDTWLWHGRRVRVVDGSTVTMPDTPENQTAYPQQRSQKFRGLYAALAEGDVILADRYFSGWCDIALPLQRGIDVVIRKHQLRRTDFRQGRRLGKDDHLVSWSKPQRPKWMSMAQYATLPNELTLREVRVRVVQKGFRTASLVVVTTLLDADRYPPEEIALLYRRRWQAELHLRSLKIVLQMDQLRCKTPERVRNEFWTHLLGYNLIRGVMASAAWASERSPWEISFKGTLQTLSQFLPILLSRISSDAWCEALLAATATHIVGNRPDRIEPRRVKRRRKHYQYLCTPRRNYKL